MEFLLLRKNKAACPKLSATGLPCNICVKSVTFGPSQKTIQNNSHVTIQLIQISWLLSINIEILLPLPRKKNQIATQWGNFFFRGLFDEVRGGNLKIWCTTQGGKKWKPAQVEGSSSVSWGGSTLIVTPNLSGNPPPPWIKVLTPVLNSFQPYQRTFSWYC